MRGIRKIAVVIATAATLTAVALPAFAADRLLNAKIEKITEKVSQKGNAYASIIVTEKKKTAGVEYEANTFVTAFEKDLPRVKTLRPGQTLKAIVNTTTGKDGRESNVLTAIVDAK